MEVNYKITGKKGRRRAVKSIEISEESYKAIKCMVERGVEMSSSINYPSLKEVYEMFGGNCYGKLVSLTITNFISDLVHLLEEERYLSVKGEDAFYNISNVILPMMCYTSNGQEYTDTLQFLNTNEYEICDTVMRCLTADKAKYFVTHLMETLTEDKRPAGEVAIEILIDIANSDKN